MTDQKRSALQILAELDHGQVMAQLTEEIHRAQTTAAAIQRPAKVQLTLTVKPAIARATPGVNAADVLMVIAAIDTKLPKPAHDPTIFFRNADGNISRNQDRQGVISGIGGAVDKATGEVLAPNPASA